MKYNAAQLLVEHAGATRDYDIDDPARVLDEGVEAVARLVGHVKLSRTNRGIVADAHIATEIRQECSRCLELVLSPVEAHIVEEFYPTVDLRTGQPLGRPEGGTGFMMTEAHEVDLAEPFRQAVLLELPMKPLCQPNCAGLCPHCGTNLNERLCSCVEESIDPRLAALADWLKADRLH